MENETPKPAAEVFGDWYDESETEDLLYDPRTGKEFPREEYK